jgi:hypothetical protein
MRPILTKIKPRNGFSSVLHSLLVLTLPIAVYVLVRLDFVQLALSIIVLSKWRMIAVRPRFWAANVRANAIDIMVGLSIVAFMTHTSSETMKLLYAVVYAAWLLVIKPSSTIFTVSVQAFIGQFFALMALYLVWGNGPLIGLTALTGLICFLTARHFMEAFDEPYAKLLSYIWGYFGAALAWLVSHWLLFYGIISLPTLLISCIGYGIAGLYYLDHFDKLYKGLKAQFVLVMIAIVAVVLIFSDWGDKVV